MKLSIAATFLAQVVPASTLVESLRSARRNMLANQDALDKKFEAILAQTASRLKVAEEKRPCDIFSVDGDDGLLSCGDGSFCARNDLSELGGECTDTPRILDRIAVNEKRPMTGRMATLKNLVQKAERDRECEPGGADIGVLACASGEHCLASAESSLGGFCRKTEEARNLFKVGICDPNADYFGFYDCDCSSLDLSTGTGSVTCLQSQDYSLGPVYNGCNDTFANVTFEYFFNYTELIAYDTCYKFGQPYSQEACTKIATNGCEVTFDGQKCQGCVRVVYSRSEVIEFDCTNVPGGRSGDTRESLLDFAPILDACYVPPPVCSNLCGAGQYIAEGNFDANVNASGIDYVTCEYLAIGEEEEDLPLETCDAFKLAARDGCCEDFPPVECFICGEGGIKNPEGLVQIGDNELVCTEAEVFSEREINQVECDLLVALSSDICCNEVPEIVSEVPSESPSAAPVQVQPSTAVGANSPDGSGAGQHKTGLLLGVLGVCALLSLVY